jgi:hypothetical protein
MSRTSKLTFKFLTELNSDSVQSTFETLGILLDYLENKDDPEPIEVQMVDTAYQTLEKLKTLEGLLKRHVGANQQILKGNKLSKLYEETSQSLFD